MGTEATYQFNARELSSVASDLGLTYSVLYDFLEQQKIIENNDLTKNYANKSFGYKKFPSEKYSRIVIVDKGDKGVIHTIEYDAYVENDALLWYMQDTDFGNAFVSTSTNKMYITPAGVIKIKKMINDYHPKIYDDPRIEEERIAYEKYLQEKPKREEAARQRALKKEARFIHSYYPYSLLGEVELATLAISWELNEEVLYDFCVYAGIITRSDELNPQDVGKLFVDKHSTKDQVSFTSKKSERDFRYALHCEGKDLLWYSFNSDFLTMHAHKKDDRRRSQYFFSTKGAIKLKQIIDKVYPEIFNHFKNRVDTPKYFEKEEFSKLSKFACKYIITLKSKKPRVKTIKDYLWKNFFTPYDKVHYKKETIIKDSTVQHWINYCKGP